MNKVLLILVVPLILLLSACNDKNNSVSNLTTANAAKSLNTIKSDQELKQYIAQGLKGGNRVGLPGGGFIDMSEAAANGSDAGSLNYSSTNLIEAGVDESDTTKYDGELLYALSGSYTEASLRIYETNRENPGAELWQEIPLNLPEDAIAEGIYLSAHAGDGTKSVFVIATTGYIYYYLDVLPESESPVVDQGWHYHGSTHLIKLVQGADKRFSESQRFSITGQYLNSRIINNRLIIGNTGAPQSSAVFELQDDEIEHFVLQTDIADLLPQIKVNDGDSRSAFGSQDCSVPGLSSLESFQPQLLYFASVSLENIEDINFLCILSESGGFYASPNSVFVTSYDYIADTTLIHYAKVNRSNLLYQASASVPGYISQAEFRLSEYDNTLRAVSSWRDDTFEPQHQLSVFSLNTNGRDTLPELSRLPNDNHPQPIGKPREDIYAVRYLKDKAFIVTFEQTDPFYVIDLANPEAPVIAGELEIPGFSTMLQPVSDELILGVGRSGGKTKLELFDVSNPQMPQSLAVYEVEHEYSYSDAEWDHHALSLLHFSEANELRLSLPITEYYAPDYEVENKLLLFTVDLSDQQLRFDGELNAGDQGYEYFTRPRSVIADDKIYFTNNGGLWSAFWETPSVLWEQGS